MKKLTVIVGLALACSAHPAFSQDGAKRENRVFVGNAVLTQGRAITCNTDIETTFTLEYRPEFRQMFWTNKLRTANPRSGRMQKDDSFTILKNPGDKEPYDFELKGNLLKGGVIKATIKSGPANRPPDCVWEVDAKEKV